MGDVVHRQGRLRRPVGLQERPRPSSFGHEDVLVAVEDVDIGLGLELLRVEIKGMGLEPVVVVEEGDEVTCCTSANASFVALEIPPLASVTLTLTR